MTINLAKFEFAKATVTYLGKVVGHGKVCPVRAKVPAVDKFPVPATKKDLSCFLGTVGYYRGFCKNFSTVVAPLTSLLSPKVMFEWSRTCQEAFESIKSMLCSAPVLAALQMEKPFSLYVDANKVGARAVLMQTNEHGVDCPVSFFSKKFSIHQLNYSNIEKEALALIWALKHFEVYMGSGASALVVYTDHNPLTFLHWLQNPNQHLMRWCLFLQLFRLDVRHVKGMENTVADAMSRGVS